MADVILGDPHIGRKFITGVPLHRRGEREQSQLVDLLKSLNEPGDDHVCLGDLFDAYTVSNTALLQVYQIYTAAAKAYPERRFFIIEGNHDVSRDTSKVSTFDIFTAMMAPFKNVIIIREQARVFEGRAFFPYNPFKSAKEVVEELTLPYDIAYGHWDVVDFGGTNVIPTKSLKCKVAVTGHVHKADHFRRDGVDVMVFGSMQPYAHGEGPGYITVTTAELAELEDTHNLNIRLIVEDGEEVPTNVDCASLTFLRRDRETSPDMVPLDNYQSVDLNRQLSEIIPEAIRDELMEVFHK